MSAEAVVEEYRAFLRDAGGAAVPARHGAPGRRRRAGGEPALRRLSPRKRTDDDLKAIYGERVGFTMW